MKNGTLKVKKILILNNLNCSLMLTWCPPRNEIGWNFANSAVRCLNQGPIFSSSFHLGHFHSCIQPGNFSKLWVSFELELKNSLPLWRTQIWPHSVRWWRGWPGTYYFLFNNFWKCLMKHTCHFLNYYFSEQKHCESLCLICSLSTLPLPWCKTSSSLSVSAPEMLRSWCPILRLRLSSCFNSLSLVFLSAAKRAILSSRYSTEYRRICRWARRFRMSMLRLHSVSML